MKFFKKEDIVGDVQQTIFIRSSDLWFSAVWRALLNYDVSCMYVKNGFVVFTTDPENDSIFKEAEALIINLAQKTFTEWKEQRVNNLSLDITSTENRVIKHLCSSLSTVQSKEICETVNEHIAFIGNVLGKNLQVVVNKYNKGGFCEMVKDADDYYWYVTFCAYEGEGNIKLTRMINNFDPVKDSVTKDNTSMEFSIEFNMAGSLTK